MPKLPNHFNHQTTAVAMRSPPANLPVLARFQANNRKVVRLVWHWSPAVVSVYLAHLTWSLSPAKADEEAAAWRAEDTPLLISAITVIFCPLVVIASPLAWAGQLASYWIKDARDLLFGQESDFCQRCNGPFVDGNDCERCQK